MSELRIGTSAWQYAHWKGRFYPSDLPTSRWLRYYAERFDTVELNNPFYRQPERKTFLRWRDAVPDAFLYAVKLNRFITHVKRLRIERDSVERSYGTLAGLGRKAAVVLVQLPARMKYDQQRAERFFRLVAPRRRRHALEPHDASWLTDPALAFLRRRVVSRGSRPVRSRPDCGARPAARTYHQHTQGGRSDVAALGPDREGDGGRGEGGAADGGRARASRAPHRPGPDAADVRPARRDAGG